MAKKFNKNFKDPYNNLKEIKSLKERDSFFEDVVNMENYLERWISHVEDELSHYFSKRSKSKTERGVYLRECVDSLPELAFCRYVKEYTDKVQRRQLGTGLPAYIYNIEALGVRL